MACGYKQESIWCLTARPLYGNVTALVRITGEDKRESVGGREEIKSKDE